LFEDGEQRRDFVHVTDVARACRLALSHDTSAGHVVNVGSGDSITIKDIALQLGRILDKERLAPHITEKFRVGDIRHCFADIRRAKDMLGFAPLVSMDKGLADLAEWLEGRVAVDSVEAAAAALAARGLTV
jgi:dTDP-L-rhamnose 4-epimerase